MYSLTDTRHIMKGARRVFGDIGNSQSQIDGDNPLSFKQPQPVAGIMKSSRNTSVTQQQQSTRPNDVKPKLGIQKNYKTIGTAAGSSVAAALRQQPSKGITGRSFRVHHPTVGGTTKPTTTTLSKNHNVGAAGVGGYNTILEEGTQIKQEVGAPRPFSKKLTRPIDLKLAETAFESETDVESVTIAFSQQRLDSPEDIDAKDASNPILVSEYINEIMGYMFALEKKFPIRSRYLDGRHVNSRMRAVLMDWLVEVHDQYNFTAETLYMCSKIMDRYLQADQFITRQELQLVGVTSLYLAAKYEEVYTPTMRDFVVISDNAFTVANIRAMEMRMLTVLKYDLSPPQPCFFLRRFSKAAFADVRLHALAKYIMELSIVDYSVSDLFPSEVASASLALALMIMERKPLSIVWSNTLEFYSKYTLEGLRPNVLKMAQVLARAHEEGVKLQAVRKKYSRAKAYLRVSRSEDLILDNWKERIMSELGHVA